ncbi:MAG: glycosyltransferase family 39 protein [Chthoniobacterales bacterium]
MSRRLAVVVAVWLTYLIGLGAPEIKGEEGRRILPAITMLETGNWIVPQIGGEPYLRKPPLVNWLVAASFKLFGARNEMTARFPSVLCVLAVALAFLTVARGSLGETGSLCAALAWLLNFGILEKGRLIEIEALYVSLFALATIWWLSCRQQRRSPWLTWLVSSVFLGLGLLAKGPLHLLFFYAIVLAVLWRNGELRALWHPAHFVGLAIMIGLFAAWAIPYLQTLSGGHVSRVWTRQFSGRLAGEDFQTGSWLLNFPRSIAYFMPWILLLPFIRLHKILEARGRRFVEGIALGAALPFLVVNLLPGALPRYAMPALVPACWLIGAAINFAAFDWRLRIGKRGFAVSGRVIRAIVAVIAIGAAVGFPLASTTFLRHREKIRNVAREIDAAIPADAPLYAVHPDYQPFLFYLRAKVVYMSAIEHLPPDARYILVSRKLESILESSPRWLPRHPSPIARVRDYRGVTVTVFRAPE